MATAKERTLEKMGKKVDDHSLKFKVDGVDVIVDPKTLTARERQLMKVELGKLGYVPDSEDTTVAAIWVVMRRNDKSLKFDDILDSITMEDLLEISAVEAGEDDSPEA